MDSWPSLCVCLSCVFVVDTHFTPSILHISLTLQFLVFYSDA
ncbi:hypothetical protein Hanom_Chr12g01116721 [Helianthus anomalus]